MAASVAQAGPGQQFARDVFDGLNRPGQKELPSQYLYDDLGSALFDAITCLPEYGLTRADRRLLEANSAKLARRLDGEIVVAELGSGSGGKTRCVLEAFADRRPLEYIPIDLSCAALARCGRELAELAAIRPIESSYLDGLEEAARNRNGRRLLVLFLGSNIGNFSPDEAGRFLLELRGLLDPGDALVLGADLVKPQSRLLAAYDDPAGVTAAFNRNLLARINRELGGDFDLRRFAHEARWDPRRRRVEMHLRSLGPQTVRVEAAGLTASLADGETIWTESSYKFLPEELEAMAPRAGFHGAAQWIDREWGFAENLWLATERA